MSEVNDLIISYQKAHSLTRKMLIEKIGYNNINKGLRLLDEFIKRPKNTDFKLKLSQQLDIPLNILDEVVNKQLSHMPNEAKVIDFVPYIQITWLKGPSLLMSINQLSHLCRIEIPNDLSNPTFEQICDLYKQHQLKHFAKILNVANKLDHYPQLLAAIETKIQDGIYISWPLGNGFTYHKSYKKHYSFNRHCELIYN